MIQRGSVHWIDLGPPQGSRPAKRRPVVVVQSDAYNRSRIGSVVVAVLTSNTQLAGRPGNVFVPAGAGGLARDSVVNVSSLSSITRDELDDAIGVLPQGLMQRVDEGLRALLDL